MVTLLETQAKAANIRLNFQAPEKPLIIKGNQDELIQMIQNLAENGIRYGHPDGQVSITPEEKARNPAAPHPAFCCIQVSDNGEGIDKAHLPRLTERFYRGR